MTLVERLREAYERYGLLQGKEAADYIERLEESAKEGMAYIDALEQERDRLRERNAVLGGLLRASLWDYETRERFEPDGSSHWSAQARAALAATGDKHVSQPVGWCVSSRLDHMKAHPKSDNCIDWVSNAPSATGDKHG